MKYFAVASAFLAATAIAQPHGSHHRRHHAQHEKRELYTEIEWVTETQYVTKLIDSTTTVWIGQETTSTTEQAKFVETPQSKKKTTTTEEAYEVPETTTSSTSVYVAPTTSSSSSSVYVAPPQSSSTVEEKKSTYVAPEPTTTSVYVAPTTYEAPAATTSAASDDSDDSGSGSGGSGNSGDITFYAIGQGSCGDNDSGLDSSVAVVALSKDYMNNPANPNLNPLCGKTVTITANGKTATAVVKDTCPGCDYGSIDVSEKVFLELFGDLGVGRDACTWTIN